MAPPEAIAGASKKKALESAFFRAGTLVSLAD